MQKLDWAVMVIYAVGMLLVGAYFSRKAKTSEDYMLGGRTMKSWMVGLSLFASLFSSISYLSVPGEVIRFGPALYLGVAIFPLVHLAVGYLLIPAIMKEKVSSAYELLELKLGPSLRVLASTGFMVLRIAWMSVIIFMCAQKIIVPIMGWAENPEAAFWVSVAMGVVTVIYTSLGGLRAVVFTDVVQTFILLGAAMFTIVLIGARLGFSSFIPEIPQGIPETWVKWKWFAPGERASFITACMGMFIWYFCTAGSDQMAIQRYLSTRNEKSARSGYKTSLICNFVVELFLISVGLGLLAYFRANPGQILGGSTIAKTADKLFPHFIVIGLPVGLTGLALAGLLAAAMSSLSSGVNSACLVISRDFVDRYKKNPISEHAKVTLAKLISVAIGVVIVALSLVFRHIRGNLTELVFKTCNLLTAALFIPFSMALFVSWAKEWATFAGTLAATATAVLVGFSAEIFGGAFKIPFVWIMPSSFVVGIVLSLFFSVLGIYLTKKAALILVTIVSLVTAPVIWHFGNSISIEGNIRPSLWIIRISFLVFVLVAFALSLLLSTKDKWRGGR